MSAVVRTLIALLGWFALALQLVIMMMNTSAVDYNKLGLQQTATNVALMAVAFLMLGLFYVTIDRLMARRS